MYINRNPIRIQRIFIPKFGGHPFYRNISPSGKMPESVDCVEAAQNFTSVHIQNRSQDQYLAMNIQGEVRKMLLRPESVMGTIYITTKDMERLRMLIEDATEKGLGSKDDLKRLEDELNEAEICHQEQMPEGVITMNSKVHLKDLDSNEDLIYTLVYPAQANIELGRISVLAPIGMAMIGYRVGDVIEWQVPGGMRRLLVKDVLYRPETWGDFTNKLYW